MNIRVVVCVFLLVSKTIAFDYEEFDLQYDSSSTIPLSSTKSTTSTSSPTTTSTTTTSTTIAYSTSSPPESGSSTPTTAATKGDRGEKRTGYRVDPSIEAGGLRTTESRKYNQEIYRHRHERPLNPKCVTEDDLMKKIHEIFLTSQQPPAPPTAAQSTTEFVVDDSLEWDASTTTIRVERDHPNPLGPVRNF
jgi:hypothetical protein